MLILFRQRVLSVGFAEKGVVGFLFKEMLEKLVEEEPVSHASLHVLEDACAEVVDVERTDAPWLVVRAVPVEQA